MASDGKGVGGCCQNNERADEIGECGMGSEGDGAEGGGHYAGENCCWDGAGEVFVDGGEEAGEWDSVVSCKSPPCTTHGQESPDEAGSEGEEDDEEEAESCARAAGSLGVDFC